MYVFFVIIISYYLCIIKISLFACLLTVYLRMCLYKWLIFKWALLFLPNHANKASIAQHNNGRIFISLLRIADEIS